MTFSQKEIKSIIDIAKEAGDLILEYYKDYKSLSVVTKEDNSPVTKADLVANNLIVKKLRSLFPDIGLVSEENSEEDNLNAAKEKKYFMIDPLDGTSSFIKKSDQFTVNIALIENTKVVLGVIYLPALDIMYYTNNEESFKIDQFSKKTDIFSSSEKIEVSNNKNNIIVICTKREPEKSEIIKDLKNKNISIKDTVTVSSSYKFCLIAEGKADLYPRRASIRAWDVAAGHAIVNGAGGSMVDLQGKEIIYNFTNDFKIPFFEVK